MERRIDSWQKSEIACRDARPRGGTVLTRRRVIGAALSTVGLALAGATTLALASHLKREWLIERLGYRTPAQARAEGWRDAA